MAPTAGKKRQLDESSGPKAKKTKVDKSEKPVKVHAEKPLQQSSNLVVEEVDFPRGGGTSFTPLEVKTIRAEAVKEADDQLFEDKQEKRLKRNRKSSVKSAEKKTGGSDGIRVEHLNYKRINAGMKVLASVVSVQPLGLIVSLPNQLMAHVPITHITSELTHRLETMGEDSDASVDDEDEDEEGPESKSHIPDPFEMFHPGQYVRTVVSAVHAQGSTEAFAVGRGRDELFKASRRVELSLVPEKVNDGVAKSDLKAGFTLSAAVKSVEDHGYILNVGVPDVSGFLSFKDAKKLSEKKLSVGYLLSAVVTKMSGNGRTCNVGVETSALTSASLSEASSATSLLPGTLVHALVTATVPSGLNLQVLGFYQGTIDQFHLKSGDVESNYTVGQKVKARVIYDISQSSPPRFALSLADHVLSLTSKSVVGADGSDTVLMQEAYPIGTVLDAVKVLRVETERGLIVEIGSGLEGFVHISQASDDHVPTLSSSSGPWKVGTIHRARVTGYFVCDGLLQLSFRQSVLEQKFLQVGEVQAGEIIRGTVKKLTDGALFVSISGNVDGVVWPNHYADIRLKHPQKRFKPGASIKCRVLTVDVDKKRIALTAKKTLIESTHPIVASLDDAKPGIVTHAVVFRTAEKSLQVEFYNGLKAMVPSREVSETNVGPLSETVPLGKVVQVRILSVEPDTGRIIASIKQASSNWKSAITDISEVEIGHSVEGVVSEIQKDKLIITLQPTQVKALLSFTNLANRRGVAIPQLRASLKAGDKIQDLVVTTRNPEKGFVLVATKPKDAAGIEKGLTLDNVVVGQVVSGRVLRHICHGALIKVSSHVTGLLHPTDTTDDYETGKPFPAQGAIIKAAVLAVDYDQKQVALSTRPSRVDKAYQGTPADLEIASLTDLKVGQTTRGFIKSVAEHGLFVTLGRGIDARVQIKNLFDEFVKDWKSRFVANQLVKGRILSVDVEKKQVEMTFRTTDSGPSKSNVTLSDLTEGQKLDGVVRKIEDYGLFIELDGTKLRGLCHKSEISDNKEADVTMALRSFREGDRVKTIVLSVDIEKRRLSLGLKPSYFADGELQADEEDSDAENSNHESLGVVDDDQDNDDVSESGGMEVDEDGEGAGDSEDEEDVMDEDDIVISDVQAKLFKKDVRSSTSFKDKTPVQTLDLGDGFQWDADDNQDQDVIMDSSDVDDDDDPQPSQAKKRKRKEIEQDLTADMHTKTPESNADFERLLLGSPSSSYLWVQYMSFQLQLSEVDKAREIAKRALKTINFREETEKLNVWLALLNLENVYGTDESLETTFKDAARHMDSKTIHLRMASIFEQSEKLEKAEEQLNRTCKKFGQSSKVWTLFGEYHFKHGDLEAARKLLPRSLQSLEKRKHLKTISKFAQLEYKLGDPERGKTIFEGIVDSHPKRWDLWSIYLDMETGQKDIASIRNLFDRLFALKMTSHKAKAFFKKWLELERRLGDEEGQEAVKAKAIEWTQRAATGTS
ncbi:rRNA bioproteinsis protein rrp5 [Steccherinum ochraceum]|uniref:Protein RRP5 homolog n=1 Tax=Steccherinum ochraceum TaxID=92696 RepID=A0A4V2MV75_9APHY|nr:rRNA bioproteinsis protein rrp5 [Steccherinum ochraceum]